MDGQRLVGQVGSYALGLVILVASVIAVFSLIKGMTWLGEIVLPWLYAISYFVLGFDVVILLPLLLFSKTRSGAGAWLFLSSYVFGITVWVMGLMLTWQIWGGLAVYVGIILGFISVIPIAMLATMFNGIWEPFFSLLIVSVLTIGIRVLGLHFSDTTSPEL